MIHFTLTRSHNKWNRRQLNNWNKRRRGLKCWMSSWTDCNRFNPFFFAEIPQFSKLLSLQIFEENNNTPIPYYKLIIDPENFANSIDNQFQVSFLFRDGYLCIADGADSSGPMVSLVTDRHKTSGHFKENKQFVGTLTPLQYMVCICPFFFFVNLILSKFFLCLIGIDWTVQH